MTVVLLSGWILLAAGCSESAQSDGAEQLDAERDKAANQILAEILEADGGSGVIAAVVVDGKLVWSGAAGMADLEADRPMRPDHLLRIGSVSKPLTAVLALKLVDLGVIDLDSSIRAYVPDLPEWYEPVTLRQLGSHTSGVRHYDFSNFMEANNFFYKQTLTEGLVNIVKEPLIAEPHTKFNYSSYGFNLLGAAIEQATGKSFTEVFQTMVAVPIGLAGTRTDHPFSIIPSRGEFYTLTVANPVMTWMKDDELINTIFRDNSDLYPAGGMLSTAEDLAKFASAVFESDFLSAQSKKTLEQPAHFRDGSSVRWNEGHGRGYYSFGWGIFGTGDGELHYLGHGGETNGAYALIRYFPKHRIAVAGIVNYNLVAGNTAFFNAVGKDLPGLFIDD